MNQHSEENHHEEHHHHKETFITKYIFSQDHKMISKQYLITGLFMGIIGIGMSLLFRIQLAWPEKTLLDFQSVAWKMGRRWRYGSQCLFIIDYHTWDHHGLFCVDCRTQWNL